MTKPDAVLVIGSGLLQAFIFPVIRDLGFAVLSTDGNNAAPGVLQSDAWYLADTSDPEATAALIPLMQEEWTIRGVVTCGADASPTVALAAERAGVSGISYDVACRTHNKLAVRQCLNKAGMQDCQPWWREYEETYTRRLGKIVGEEIGYPCVVKPLSQRASRGITLVDSMAQLQAGIRHVFEYGPVYLIEERLRGTEHSAEMILGEDGQVYWRNIVDRGFDYRSGVPLETGHVNPTELENRVQEDIFTMMHQAAHALGVTWGPFKIDCLVTADDAPYILECTARLSGGFDSQRTSPLTGRHPMRQLVQLACGLPVDPQPPAQGYAACAAILPQRSGVVRHLPVYDVSWPAAEVVWAIHEGDTVSPAVHNGARPGFVLAHASTYAKAWDTAALLARWCEQSIRCNPA